MGRSDQKKGKKDPAYIALAEGPGSLARAAELAAEEPVTDPPQEPSQHPDHESGPRPADDCFRDEHGQPVEGSPVYLRMLEELSFFMAPQVARKMLDLCLEDAGSTPQDATTLELREILLDALPACLKEVLDGDSLDAAIEGLEQVLVNIHRPPRGQRPSTPDGQPAVSSTPPEGV